MKRHWTASAVLSGVVAISSTALGALWEPRPVTERTIETGIGPIPVAAGILVARKGKAGGEQLQLTGAGIRVKTVLLFQANVYVIQSFAKLSATEQVTPQSILSSPTRALELTFLRDLSASQIREAFVGAMERNGVTLGDSAIQAFLTFVAKDVKSGETLQMLAEKKGDDEVLSLESGSRNETLKGKSLASDVWKIWLGETDDSGLQELRARLCGLKRAS